MDSVGDIFSRISVVTCKDCIHYHKVKYPIGVTLPDDDIAKTHGNCTVSKVNVWVKPNCEPCELFEDSWESISK